MSRARSSCTPRQRTSTGRVSLMCAALSLATLCAASAVGQVSPSNAATPTGEAGSAFYIPGMPVPEAEAQTDAEAPKARRGGKISKVSKVDRTAVAAPRGLDRNTLQVGEIYRGVVPGIHDWQYFARRARDAARKNPRRGNRLTWIGYQPREGGSSIFVQTIKAAVYEVHEGVDKEGKPTLEVSLIGTRVPVYNNRRTLDTSYFPTAVIGVRARPARKSTLVTISLQSQVRYSVRQEAEFLYIDFEDAGTQPYADSVDAKKNEALPSP